MLKSIFFDLDDVLADLKTGFHAEAGVPLRQELEEKEGKKAYWGRIDHARPGFWENLPIMPGAHNLVAMVMAMFPQENVHILSAVFNSHPECEIEKRSWVNYNFSSFWATNVNIVQRKEKKNFAKEIGDILVDDHRRNCREWADAGGTALLHTSVMNTEFKLKLLAERYGIAQ